MIAETNNGDWDRNGVREQYQNDENTRAFLDRMAQYQRNPSKTEVDALQDNPGMARKAAIEVLRGLADKGCGVFKNGRHDHRSRIEWGVSAIKVAQDAREAIGQGTTVTSPPVNVNVEYIEHTFRIRRDAVATIRTPLDMTKEEAEKLSEHVRNSWLG